MHAVSLVPTHGSQMMYATLFLILSYTCDPALTALFTPPRPEAGRYEVCTTPEPLQSAAEGLQIDSQEPLEAFGAAAPYNRAALAQLYGGRRVQVARRWHDFGDRFESETLLSPYPDATLTRLMPGTMVVIWRLRR